MIKEEEMAGMRIVTLNDIRATALHDGGNAAVLSELSELFTQQMQDSLGEPVSSRDPLRPGYIPISEVGSAEDPGAIEDEMIALIDAGRPRRTRKSRKSRSRRTH